MNQSLPIEQDRIEVIDVLRGFTLFGIALVHFTEQFYAGMPPEGHNIAGTAVIDQVVSGIVGIFIQGKFFMIFSFLFGMSFFIQLSKTHGSSGFVLRFLWRLIVLFGIGLLHQIHYRGDILTIYAILG
ncbi:MAG TPA: heparan-alpha-glucosaminide N-acetyltransferase domain-containing protein, partial [Saprospiraceae bacterium]|nr:heparan-alpha-glucosaminide N-acetyltransferase domain-containing protein [Saprospiraceae bacterium]